MFMLLPLNTFPAHVEANFAYCSNFHEKPLKKLLGILRLGFNVSTVAKWRQAKIKQLPAAYKFAFTTKRRRDFPLDFYSDNRNFPLATIQNIPTVGIFHISRAKLDYGEDVFHRASGWYRKVTFHLHKANRPLRRSCFNTLKRPRRKIDKLNYSCSTRTFSIQFFSDASSADAFEYF